MCKKPQLLNLTFSLAAALTLITAMLTPVHAANENLPKQYRDINVQGDLDMVEVFLRGATVDKHKQVEMVKANPENYSPVVLAAMGQFLINEGNRKKSIKMMDEAIFWYYAGHLRANYDFKRCTDPTAFRAVDNIQTSFGQLVARHARNNLDELQATIKEILEWDEKTEHKYDHRWINLHTATFQKLMEMKESEREKAKVEPLSKPESEWEQIAEDNRNNYYQRFKQSIEDIKELEGLSEGGGA